LVSYEEQTQELMLHEPISLRRSMRERRSFIPNDYVVFLQENEENNGMMEDDQSPSVKLCKILTQENGLKKMNGEYKSIQENMKNNLIVIYKCHLSEISKLKLSNQLLKPKKFTSG